MPLFQNVAHFPPAAIAIKLAIALAVGMTVGFERESANKDVGIRTFGLVSLLGALSVLISAPYVLVSLAGVIVLVAFLNARSMLGSGALEVTTSASLLVTYALGVLVGLGHTFTPVASAILMTLLLAWKVELRRFAGGVSVDELRSAVLLGLIGFVIYPVLPNRFVDPWELVNPREAWVSVVMIASIAFVNYVLLRLYSTRGLYWTAALGGLVNSRAVVVELSALSPGSQSMVMVVMLTTLAMFVRNILVLAIFAPRALFIAIGPLSAMACVALLLCLGRHDDGPGKELALGSPISLKRVLSYAALFVAIQAGGTLAARIFGNLGFMVASIISGVASSASATAAAANLASSGKISAELAGTAAVLGSMASALTSIPLVVRKLSGTVLARVLLTSLLQLAVGIAVLAAQHHFLAQ